MWNAGLDLPGRATVMGPTMGHTMPGPRDPIYGTGHRPVDVGSCVPVGGISSWVTVLGSQKWGYPCDNGVTHSEQACKCSNLFFAEGFCGSPGRVYAGLVVQTQPRVVLIRVSQEYVDFDRFLHLFGVNFFWRFCRFLVICQMKESPSELITEITVCRYCKSLFRNVCMFVVCYKASCYSRIPLFVSESRANKYHAQVQN